MNTKKYEYKKIAIFGSAFNPPTLGHATVIKSLAEFDEILLVPSIAHPWGKEMPTFSKRCTLVKAFINDLNLACVKLSTIEQKILDKAPTSVVTSFAVLQELQLQNKKDELTLVIGPDNFKQFNKFYKSETILKTWKVLVCPEKLPIHSTVVRKKLLLGENITDMVSPLVYKLLVK